MLCSTILNKNAGTRKTNVTLIVKQNMSSERVKMNEIKQKKNNPVKSNKPKALLNSTKRIHYVVL